MKIQSIISGLCLTAITLSGCAKEQVITPIEPTNSTPPISSALFLNTDVVDDFPVDPHIIRSRVAKLNIALLLDESGQARDVKEITINLFPDVVYTGVIKEVQEEGDGYTWVGNLKDIEYSELTMVYTSGVFIGHFAHPQGVYEFSIVGDDLYRIIMIDQQKLQGGEG